MLRSSSVVVNQRMQQVAEKLHKVTSWLFFPLSEQIIVICWQICNTLRQAIIVSL